MNNDFNNIPEYPQTPPVVQAQPVQNPAQPPVPPVPPQAPQVPNGYVPPQPPQPAVRAIPQEQQPAQQVQPPQAPQPQSAPQPQQALPYYPPQPQQYQQPRYAQYRSPYQPQKQPMSSGVKIFLAVVITFLVMSVVGFVMFVTLNPSDGGFVEDTTEPSTSYSFTSPTEPTSEYEIIDDDKEYPESDAQKETDPSYKGLSTENKPKKAKSGEYGSAYAFSKVEKSVVGVICYGDGQEGTATSYQSMGSGIVISKDGYIVTNSHIVNHSRTAYKIKIVTSDKKEYKAGVVGYDSRNDIAVLKADAKNLTPAQFGNSGELKVTEDIIVVGNPLGLSYQNSVTKGIISALDRQALSSNNAKVIQTDAAINPGNSGGPMVNMYGQVVGIATAKIALDDYEGMAFAIPGNTAKKIVDSIIRNGYVKGRVRIGVVGLAVTKSEAGASGIQISEVVSGGPMDGKDVKADDIMTKVDGKEIATFSEVYSILEKYKAGDKVKITLYRPSTSSTFDVEITLQEDKAE